MPTIMTHAVSAALLTSAFPASCVPRRLVILGAICAMAPDADVLGFPFGVPYEALWGHRGLTHSLLFALGFSALAWFVGVPYVVGFARRAALLLYLFVATASHGVLDAFTNGGLGIAFFSPFNPTRYFFSFSPIEVSPIGVSFFSARGLSVLQSEFVWVWLPFIAFAIAAIMTRRLWGRSRDPYASTRVRTTLLLCILSVIVFGKSWVGAASLGSVPDDFRTDFGKPSFEERLGRTSPLRWKPPSKQRVHASGVSRISG